MGKGTYIDINTATIAGVSSQATKLGSDIESLQGELRSDQGELSESLTSLEDYVHMCFEKAVPIRRLDTQKETVSNVVSLLARASDLAEEASRGLVNESEALHLAVDAMTGVTSCASVISVIVSAINGETSCGDDWVNVGTWAKSPLEKNAKITSHYGPRSLYGSFHYGVDFGIPAGTQVKAPISGTVVKAYTQSGGGNCVYLKGDDGYLYEFAHLSKFQCKTGDRVETGDNIALSGATGKYVTGPHLHFGVYQAGQALTEKNTIIWKQTSSGDWYIPGSVDPEKHFSEQYGITL